MLDVERGRAVADGDGVVEREAGPQLEILARKKGAEAPGLDQRGAANGERGGLDDLPLLRVAKEIDPPRRTRRIVGGGDGVGRGDALMTGRDHRRVGAFRRDLGQRRQMIGLPQIVGVEERDPLAVRLRDSAVARRAGAGVGLPHQSHAFAEQIFDARHAAVGRTVVNDDDLVGAVGLGERGFERGADEACLVVERDHHAHRERAHRSRFVRGAAGGRLAVTSA